MKIAGNVYKIPGNSNIYLILGEKNILIDTSDAVDSVYIKSEIEKIIPLENIDVVLFTHLHYDHAGNLELFSDAKFYASKTEIENYRNSPRDFFFHDISEKNDKILREKLIPLPEKIENLKVIDCPGHTRGSVAFLDEKNKILFSGDTVFDNGIGRTDLPNSDAFKMQETLEKLFREINNKKLKVYSGHDY